MANGQSKSINEGVWTFRDVEIRPDIDWEDRRKTLLRVQVSKHENFERIEFEFSGATASISKIRYADPPFNLGESEEIAEIAGETFLEIILTPAYAHDKSGKENVREEEDPTGLESIKGIRRIYDLEGQVIYVLGLSDKKRFRVQAITNPSRLIVDVNNY